MKTEKESLRGSRAFIEIEYDDKSSFSFDVILHAITDRAKVAEIQMITRGTLMASSGARATAYNDQGFEICAYIR